jgi:hypothetical protein
VMLKPFTAEDLYQAMRDAITCVTDLAAVAETEIVQGRIEQARVGTGGKSYDAGADDRLGHRGP